MADSDPELRRPDARGRTRRDLERLQRREPPGHFARSLALVGSVGWPIVILATGGALLGHYLDGCFETGIHFTLILLTAGTTIGCVAVYRTMRGGAP